MVWQKEQKLINKLKEYADELDIAPYQKEEATQKYIEMGTWLQSGEFLKDYAPDIFPHGSFALGTVVKPNNREEFDLDIISILSIDSEETANDIKKSIKERLEANPEYKQALDRDETFETCLTFKFSKKFKMDVVPAINGDRAFITKMVDKYPSKAKYLQKLIRIPRKGGGWKHTNPVGFKDWFLDVSEYSKRKIQAAYDERVHPSDIKDWRYKAPLQRAVQLLKKHASATFEGELAKYKPSSIVITTLAAKSYEAEDNLYTCLSNFVKNSLGLIGCYNGTYSLPNPVYPEENFLESWTTDVIARKYFFKWLSKVSVLLQNLENNNDAPLQYLFADSELMTPLDRFETEYDDGVRNKIALLRGTDRALLDVKHREKPLWSVSNVYGVDVLGYARKGDGLEKEIANDDEPLDKKMNLVFAANTNTPEPYDVYWQVVNTGNEARELGNLRGGIIRSPSRFHEESTLYKGKHWVECYVIKNGTCVAKSEPFFVNIK